MGWWGPLTGHLGCNRGAGASQGTEAITGHQVLRHQTGGAPGDWYRGRLCQTAQSFYRSSHLSSQPPGAQRWEGHVTGVGSGAASPGAPQAAHAKGQPRRSLCVTDTVLSPPPSPSWECGYPGSLWVSGGSGHRWPWGQTPAVAQRAGPGHSSSVMPARETPLWCECSFSQPRVAL